MTDDALIADLVLAGVSPELVARVANAMVQIALSGGNRVDAAIEKRRAWDREYRRSKRSIPPDFHPNPPDTQNATLKEVSKKDIKKERGSRIPPDWLPSETDREFASSKGMLAERILLEIEKFRNYWTAKSGAASTKLDWSATWRNWVLSSLERNPPAHPPRPPPDAKPAYLTPPPGCEPLEVINARFAAARKSDDPESGTQVRNHTGVGANGAHQPAELPLSGGAALLDQDRRSSG